VPNFQHALKIEVPKSRADANQFVWVIACTVLVYLPLRIISFGFLPPDDALRYAAKAVSGKTWREIVLLRPEITIDHNLGWDWILTGMHHMTHWDAANLVFFSVVLMFLVFTIAPMPWLKRPESWLASLAVVLLVFPYFAVRAFVGRPLFVSMAVTLVLLSLWIKPGEKSRRVLIASALLMAFAVWVHGSFYLLTFIPFVFFLAQRWRDGLKLLLCWAAGSLLGALATGRPSAVLYESILIPIMALGQNAPVDSLVGEFQPFDEGYPALIVVGVVLLWRKCRGLPVRTIWRDPVFLMAVIGWVLGIRIFRFWLDWGIPALALWLAREFDQIFETHLAVNSWRRPATAALLAFLLCSGLATDSDARWSQYSNWQSLDSRRPDHVGWLPDPGGILYCVNMSVFYETFFTNPHGDWRYALGFEPSLMLPEDYAVYKELWRTKNAVQATAPWVAKMTPADRLVLLGPAEPKPTIPELEWFYAADDTWVGRLPKNQGPLQLHVPVQRRPTL